MGLVEVCEPIKVDIPNDKTVNRPVNKSESLLKNRADQLNLSNEFRVGQGIELAVFATQPTGF